jgi:predicted metal-dependent phosphoesterase TrpH
LHLKQLAVTDHDTTAGVAEAIAAAGQEIEIIPAVEINTVHEGVAGEREDIHILGYFVDLNSTALKTVLAKQQQARQNHVLETIASLQKIGLAIDESSVRRHAGLGSIGRAHITQAIVEAGGAADLTAAYEKFMKRSSPFYVPRQSVSPSEAIEAINDAGGISSIAHPGKESHINDLILRLREHGLQAIEAFHRVHSLNRVRHYIRLAHQNNMLITGGSDCHGPYEQFASTMGSISMPEEVMTKLRSRYQG